MHSVICTVDITYCWQWIKENMAKVEYDFVFLEESCSHTTETFSARAHFAAGSVINKTFKNINLGWVLEQIIHHPIRRFPLWGIWWLPSAWLSWEGNEKRTQKVFSTVPHVAHNRCSKSVYLYFPKEQSTLYWKTAYNPRDCEFWAKKLNFCTWRLMNKILGTCEIYRLFIGQLCACCIKYVILVPGWGRRSFYACWMDEVAEV